MSNLQKINLLGSSFSLKVDEDPEYFKKVINHVEKMFTNIDKDAEEVEQMTMKIISLIDETIK